MKYRKIKHIVIFLFITSSIHAQNPRLDFQRSVMVYNLSTFEQEKTISAVSPTYTTVYTNTLLQIFHPTVAFRWKTVNNNFHEIELTQFSLGSTGARVDYIEDSTGHNLGYDGNVLVSTSVQCRYEYIRTFNKTKDKKVVPAIGFGIKPFYGRTDLKYTSGRNFPVTTQSFGVDAQLVPRISCFFTERIFFDVNVPFTLFYLDHEMLRHSDPTIPPAQRTVTSFNFEALPTKFSLRIGVGIKL